MPFGEELCGAATSARSVSAAHADLETTAGAMSRRVRSGMQQVYPAIGRPTIGSPRMRSRGALSWGVDQGVGLGRRAEEGEGKGPETKDQRQKTKDERQKAKGKRQTARDNVNCH